MLRFQIGYTEDVGHTRLPGLPRIGWGGTAAQPGPRTRSFSNSPWSCQRGAGAGRELLGECGTKLRAPSSWIQGSHESFVGVACG